MPPNMPGISGRLDSVSRSVIGWRTYPHTHAHAHMCNNTQTNECAPLFAANRDGEILKLIQYVSFIYIIFAAYKSTLSDILISLNR